MSDYWKKKLDELNKSNAKSSSSSSTKSSSSSSNYWDNKMSELEQSKKKKKKDEDDIAPVVTTTTKKKDDDKKLDFFQKGAFEDGYQFGDIAKTILGTVGDVGVGAVKGVSKMVGGVIDAGTYGVAGVADAIGEDDFADRLRVKAKENVIDNAFKKTDSYLDQYSVLGRTGDAVAEGLGQVGAIILTGGLAGAAGLGAAGVTATTTGVMGVSSLGSGMSEAYQSGATDEEAATYGLIKGVVDAGSELIFGGLGKTVKALGVSRGLSSLDDVFAQRLSSKIANQTAKNFVEYGVKASAEGVEEVLAGLGSAVGKKLTYMDDEELSALIRDENLLEQFVVGTVASGIAQSGVVPGMKGGSLREANETGRDFISGMSENEQKVIDKEYENRIAEQEKDGNTLSDKEKSKIYDAVVSDMEKGYISTDTIEEVLGGDTFKSYRDTVDSEDALAKEFEELGKKQNATLAEQSRYNDLKQQMDEIKQNSQRNTLKSQLSEEVMGLVQNDRLAESYNERARRGQAYEADLTKYNEKQQAVIQKAVDSGILNNTRRTHEFVDMIAKISADKGVLFDFTNNEKLKGTSFAVEGKTVNGFVTKDGVTLNIDSAKSLNSVVGHEITHVLEGTELYAELQTAVMQYAKTKNGVDYRSRVVDTVALYKDIEGADPKAELTADLIGDYLFTDPDFINSLSTNNRNVFQKIYDEIKYLCKVATAGSKEARELEKVKRAFEKAYKADSKAESDTKYSVSDSSGKELTTEQQEYFKDSKMRNDNGDLMVMYHGSQDAGFHVFDAKMSDDDTSFFFVDRNDVAATYSGTTETYEAKTIRTAEDMNNFLAEIGYDHYEAVERNGKFELLENNDHVAWSDTAQGIYEEFCWYEGVGEGDANYKVYLNLKNPLVVDAQDRNWNNISREYSQEVADRYHSLTAEEKAALTDIAEWGEYGIFRDEMLAAAKSPDSSVLASAYEKLGGANANLYDAFSIAEDNFSEESIKQFAVKQMNTRDYAQRAKEQGYDGVIFKNIHDNGGYSNGSEGASTVAIAFESNQIKSTANEKPTAHKDIRYSLSGDDRVFYTPRGIEVVQNPSDAEYRQMRAEIYKEYPWLRGTGEAILRHTYDESGNEYYWNAFDGMHMDVEPYINKQYNTRTSQHWQWWTKEDKDDYPTDYSNVRYSLSDTEGRELSPAIQKRFANSKAVDENGNLKVLYHGTYNGEFSVFDKSKGFVEDDYGSGFYFSDNEADVSDHYEGGGPDYENKVARLAERIADDEDIDYEEAEEKAREQLFKGSHKFEVYLNIENPAIVGETILMDSEAYLEQYNEEDYEDYDDYIADVEQLVADEIDNVVWEVEQKVDFIEFGSGTDDIRNILFEAYAEGGIGMEELKSKINELYLEDENGQLVGNEVTRQIIESLGYDGIIDPTVSTKWNMNLDADTTHYIVFKPNQIKAVTNQNPTDNPDIHLSVSGRERRAYGSYNVYGKDIALQEVAPVAISKTETTTEPVTRFSVDEMFPDDLAPVQSEIDRLQAEKAELESRMTPDDAELEEQWWNIQDRINALEKELAADESSRMDSLSEEDMPPEQDAPYYEDEPAEDMEAEDPFEDREMSSVSSPKVNAYMYDHPEVKPFFQAEAAVMLEELTSTTKGERWYNDHLYYETGGEQGYGGTKRHTSESIAKMLDEWNMSYADIEKGLNAIIKDNGAENIAAAKKVEFMLNERLLDGYKSFVGWEPTKDRFGRVPQNQEYINMLAEQQIVNAYSQESFDALMAEADKYAPPISEEIAPVAMKRESNPTVAIKPKREKQPKLARATQEEQARAEILTEEPKVEKKKPSAWSMIKNNVLDKGMVFEDLSLATGNRELQARWNSIRYANSKAQRLMEKGNASVSSLKSIRETVEKTGKTKEFYEYLYHLHNADRMTLADRYEDTPNKPVFGDSVTAEMSLEAAKKLERANPRFKLYANDVYAYMGNLRELLVENGVISRETAKLWSEMYPHYVPIRRVGDTGLNINVPLDTGRTGINAPIKRATGGSRDILPLFDTMGQRTMQTYKAIAKNRFGVELKNTLRTTIADEDMSIDEAVEGVDAHEELLQEGKNGKKPTFTVFEDGKKVTFEITEEMYNAMKPASEGLSYTNKVLNTANNIRRGLLTEYNPAFMLTNPIKDTQDVLINSQHPARTYANYPRAVAELIGRRGHWYQEYMDNGGERNTYFEQDTNTFAKEKGAIRKIVGFPLDKISDINNFIERVPRLAEYIASRKNGQSVDVAMLDAARVTTNFAAGGDLTKFLNRNGATFLNASVQGFVQQVRNVREAKANGLKGALTLATKLAAAGLPAMLLNHLLWDDDEEYAELSDYVKQNYYIVGKYDDGKFVRIPKGRALAVIQNAFEQMENMITGDDELDLATFGELVLSNLAPNNPLDNHIFAPIAQAWSNRTWYGDDLVPTRLQDLPAAEQYDETTDEISKWLGEKTNLSPYKLNYLLDQYSGGVGDMFLPRLTLEAERGDNSMIAPISDKFTTDGVLKNQNISDFYDTMDELNTNAKSSKATDEDVLKQKYMNSVNSELAELYAKKREVQNGDLPDAEKYEEVRMIQQQIVDLTRDSLNSYEDVSINGKYARVGDVQFRWYEPGEDSTGEPGWKKLTDKQSEKQDEVTSGLGIDASEYWGNKEEYDYAYESPEKYAVAKSVGGYEAFRNYTSELYDIKADKDENGDSIRGSRKEKVLDWINNLDADYGTKIILFKNEYNADDTYNYEIIEYLESREDISGEEMETILKELGFDVDSNGNISW